jgi:anti-anti-sigma regulatory factor
VVAAWNSSVGCDEFSRPARSFRRMDASIVLTVGDPLAPADLPAFCERTRELLEESGADLVVCDVRDLTGADALTLDLIARLQLTAKRLGARVCVRNASERLCELLAFTGIAEVCGLRVELERQPEQGEEGLRVEEEGELDDATA